LHSSWQSVMDHGTCPCMSFPLKLPLGIGHSGPTSNTLFLGPTCVHNPNDISIGSAIFANLTTKCRCTLQQAAPFPFKIAPFHGSEPPFSTWFHGPTQILIPNNISIGSAVFAQLTAECPYTLQWAALALLKIVPSLVWCGPHLIHGSFAHPSPQPKWHLDRLSHFCRADYCDRMTDQATRPVTVLGHIYVRSSVIWPNNASCITFSMEIHMQCHRMLVIGINLIHGKNALVQNFLKMCSISQKFTDSLKNSRIFHRPYWSLFQAVI